MAEVFAMWHGGPNYAHPYNPEHVESFPSVNAVADAMRDRMANRDGSTPCVQDSSALVYRFDPRGVDDAYPDLILTEGPRGGIRRERT